jgi:hypothetical protein
MSGTRRKPGRTGPFVVGFQSSLLEQGYSALTVCNMLKDLGAVGRWMQERDLQPDHLSLSVIAEFHADCLARGRRKIPSVKSFEPLLQYLRTEGVIADPPEPESPMGRLLADYRRWLVTERGLAESTVIRYENLARRFLELHSVGDGVDAAALTGAEVVAFRRLSQGPGGRTAVPAEGPLRAWADAALVDHRSSSGRRMARNGHPQGAARWARAAAPGQL